MPVIDKLGLLILNDRKLLNARSHGKTMFYIPGGKREPGESDAAALVREIMEELGVILDPASLTLYGAFQAQADGKPPGTEVRITCYFGNYTGEPAAHHEVEELRYLGNADHALITPTTRLIFAQLTTDGLLAD